MIFKLGQEYIIIILIYSYTIISAIATEKPVTSMMRQLLIMIHLVWFWAGRLEWTFTVWDKAIMAICCYRLANQQMSFFIRHSNKKLSETILTTAAYCYCFANAESLFFCTRLALNEQTLL